MSRAYKNKKFNTDNYTKYAVSSKYFGLQASRFPGSIKKQYCDETGDGFANATYTKRRSEAVGKGTTCIYRSMFPPSYGPSGLGVAPLLGPTNLATAFGVSNAGPSGLASTIVKPALGPQSLEEKPFPDLGPQDLITSIVEPASGPQNLLAELPPEPMYTLVSFSDGSWGNMYGSPDGRWYPKDVDDKALYLGEDAPYKYYAFPLSPEGQRFTIVPETQASYFSDVSRGAGVGTNLWEWYWYKYTPSLGPYQVIGSAANYVKYDSSTPNPNIGTPKFSLWLAYPNVLLRDLQYNPYNRFAESEVLAIKASLEAGNGTGSPVGSAMRLSVYYNEEFRTHDSQYPPNPY